MIIGDPPFCHPREMTPRDILQQFVGIFARKGWLNQSIRLKHGNRQYRVSCGEAGFLAYRINDHYGLAQGFPGWPVCIITQDGIMHDAAVSAFPSTEPSTQEWLRRLADDDFELI